MTRQILKYPDPVLKNKSEEVEEITDEIRKLAQDLKETMFTGQGIGLAAPQVGVLKRIIAVQEKTPLIFINPRIIKKSRETISEQEGCLSFPGLFLKIKRAKEVEVETLLVETSSRLAPRSPSPRDADEGEEKNSIKKVSFKAQGLLARVLQHEIDHLDGILCIDRLSFWQKLKIKLKSWT